MIQNMYNKKIFKSINGLELIVLNKKSSVIFEIENNESDNKFDFRFELKTLKELFDYFKDISNEAWGSIKLKECRNESSDYAEYYDRKLDNNGYLELNKNGLTLERVSLGKNKLYQFSKLKMQLFLYDFNKVIGSLNLRGNLK